MSQNSAARPLLRSSDTGESTLDRRVHDIGLVAASLGGLVLVAAVARSGQLVLQLSIAIYLACLMAMLLCSAAYNRARNSRRRGLLRQLDHAAIFLMIAGTYTPFTMNRLPFAWSVATTAIIWAIALSGAALKLARPGALERVSVLPYLALGWVGLIAFLPLVTTLDMGTLSLLAAGVILYTAGTLFHLWDRLPYSNAIWHGFVVAAAACHYAAILHGVVGVQS